VDGRQPISKIEPSDGCGRDTVPLAGSFGKCGLKPLRRLAFQAEEARKEDSRAAEAAAVVLNQSPRGLLLVRESPSLNANLRGIWEISG